MRDAQRPRSAGVVNAMTVDVEDYFQVSAFEAHVGKSQWDSWPLRVEDNTQRILDLFAAHGVRGTFYLLGCRRAFPKPCKENRQRGT